MGMRFAVASCLALGLMGAETAGAGEPLLIEVAQTPVLSLELRGVGQLRFGARLEWKLVVEPPQEIRPGDGVRLGSVAIHSGDGRVNHVLPEPPAYSYAENGVGCIVLRVQNSDYAVIRCNRDYVFNLRTGTAPVLVAPQFKDRVNPSPQWLAELPLPWWRETGVMIPGTSLLFLEYGYTHYGQLIESTEELRGPALLDLGTGRIAIARTGDAADAPVYDASAASESEPIAVFSEHVVADRMVEGRRVVTVATVLDRCTGARCRGEDEAEFRRIVPLSYVFE